MGIALYKVEKQCYFVGEEPIKENAPQVVACGVLFCVRRMNATF